MKYVCITDIDAQTKVICTEAPMRNGPGKPEVKGFQFVWSDESTWPIECNQDGSYTRTPKYYGSCDDDANTALVGVLEVLSEQEFNQRKRDEMYARQPFASWVFDEQKLLWNPPVEKPNDEKPYYWNEDTKSWIGVTNA